VIPVQADAATTSQLIEPKGPLLRLRWALATALAGGLALAAAFPPLGVWPLAVAGPALLAIALHGRSLRASFSVGLVFGIAFFFPLLAWVINLAWYPWVALAGASALIFAVLAIAQRLLLRLPFWPLAVAGWWVAAEALRDRWPWGGFPWGRLAMSQAGAPTQGWVAIGGAPLLTFLIALVGGTLAWLTVTMLAVVPAPRARQGQPAGRPARQPAHRRAGLAALSLAAAAGLAVIAAALPLDPVPHGTPTSEVAAIQGDVPRARTLETQLNDWMVTANHEAATQQLAQRVKNGSMPAPDIVVWPENSTDIDPTKDPTAYNQISAAAVAIGSPILVGAVLQDPFRNAGLLWLPGKGPTTMYVKRRLVPFGEYIPFRSLINKITSLTRLQPQDFVPGHSTVLFRAGQIRLGDVICWEVGFDDLVRSAGAGANLLAMQSNDATYERDGQTGESGQQLAMARIRAVEHDRAVVVASTSGYSAIIAPGGQIVTQSGTWQQAELEARVPLVSYTTLADRVGAWPEYVIVALTILAAAYAAARAVQERRARSGNTAAGPAQAG